VNKNVYVSFMCWPSIVLFIVWFRAGVDKLRPAGRMRHATAFRAARRAEGSHTYVVHIWSLRQSNFID